jgi:hypothetical protein
MGLFKKILGKPKKKIQSNVSKQGTTREKSQPTFPVGDNHIDDSDIYIIADLSRWYPLPQGFSYKVDSNGSPFIERQSDHKRSAFLIEAGLLTFDEPSQRSNGKTIYKTTEVFKVKR